MRWSRSFAHLVAFGLGIFTPTHARMLCGLPQEYEKSDSALDPRASPDQTIGDFFATNPSFPRNPSSKRQFVHTRSLIEVVWSDAQTTYNVSLSRCLTMLDIIGIYTVQNGTTLYNATAQEIVNDIRARKGSESANRLFYASRVRENAELAIDAAQSILKTAIVDYNPSSSSSSSSDNNGLHNELRKLLAPTEEWAALMVRTAIIGGLSTCIHNSQKHWQNDTFGLPISNATVFAIVPAAISIIEGIVSIILGGRLTYIESTVLSMFLGWFRNLCFSIASDIVFNRMSSGIPINRTKETLLDNTSLPLSIGELRKSASGLGSISSLRLRIGAIAETGSETCT